MNDNTGHQDLAGWSVLVTRPVDQAARLCELIEQAGGRPVRFPVIEICTPHDENRADRFVSHLDDYDIAVFISANAARFAFNKISKTSSFPGRTLVAAIGLTTAKKLEDFGCHVDIVPQNNFNSEALLDVPEMRDVSGKKIIIFCGEGGREYLADRLQKRGASVFCAEVYRRVMPKVEVAGLLHAWQNKEVSAVTVTSQEALQNLAELLGDRGRALLCKTPLVVISDRMLDQVNEMGISAPVMVASKASDAGILAALKSLRALI